MSRVRVTAEQAAAYAAKGLVCDRGNFRAKLVADPRWAAVPSADGPFVCVTVPVKTVSETNHRDAHWAQRSRRAAGQREAVALALLGVDDGTRAELAKGCTVRLTRVSVGRLDELNLGAAVKHVADAVAVWLLGGEPGEMDGDPRITWELRQLPAPKRGVCGVIVSITPRG
jgi:hypothetical protein